MPAGLADGLALKEQRYVRQRRTIRPNNLGPRFPDIRSGIRLGCGQASTPRLRLPRYITATGSIAANCEL
jgi:hypothetical protein